jgi:hypothetical protein
VDQKILKITVLRKDSRTDEEESVGKNERRKIGVGSVGVTTAEVFGGKGLTQAVLSGRGVCRVGRKEMSARNLHFFYSIYF